MESMDRFAETAKIRGTKGSNLVSGTIISVAREARHTNTRISLLKYAALSACPPRKYAATMLKYSIGRLPQAISARIGVADRG